MSVPGDYMLDPPDDPPFGECPDCEGAGRVDPNGWPVGPDGAEGSDCEACEGKGERHATVEEIRDAAAEAAIERAEARRDGDL